MSDCTMAEYKGMCCCSCKFHLQDFHHCTTVEERECCVCGQPKGWICAGESVENGHYHSGWTEHGLCEMWDRRNDA